LRRPRARGLHLIHGKEADPMHRTQLREAISLRETLPKAHFLAEGDVLARSCAADWRACQAGDVFFAVTTADDDGHEHAFRAVERGATAIVAERLLPAAVPQVLVRDSRAALSRVCQALAGNPSDALSTIGIAGSVGKTTTAMLMAAIFEAAQQAAGVMSSLGNSDSLTQSGPDGATPTAPEYASWLARMQTAGCEAAVLEMSSQALAERRVSGIHLDAAIITNIKNDLPDPEFLPGTFQKIVQRIFKLLKAGGVAVVNADDHRCRRFVTQAGPACLTYGLHAEADVTASVVERSISEQTFFLAAGGDVSPVRTRIIGDPHVSNCLAAATTALALGYDLDAIVRGLEMVERIPFRMERLECGQPFGVVLDSARGPESLAQAIRAVRQVTRGRVHVVIRPPFECTSARRALLGRVPERGAHAAILTGEETGLAHDVIDGFERPARARIIPSRGEAIRYCLYSAQPGDVVLVAGCEADSDREVALDWLFDRPAEQASKARFRVVG
jgi:UDP-N-acetylmuramoyl-L-alanyl-D-glutamate--2,6-diaminopimelate ligase